MSSFNEPDFVISLHSSAAPLNLTAAQMDLVDRIMVEHYRIGLIQMMENAGRALARLACIRFLGGDVALAQPVRRMKPTPKRPLGIIKRMGIEIRRSCEAQQPERNVVLLDGLIGYSLRGAPIGFVAGLIRGANDSGAPILALDAPSGVDVITDVAFDPAIRADAMLTLALPNTVLRMAGGPPRTKPRRLSWGCVNSRCALRIERRPVASG